MTFRFVLSLISLFAIIQLTTPAISEEVGVANLSNRALDWIVHQETGRVFCTMADIDQVVEFNSKGDEVRRIDVGGKPAEMLIKNGKLVVGCQKDSELYVVDLNTNKVEGKIAISMQGPIGMFCSKADNDFVYGISSQRYDKKIFQADIKNKKIRNNKTLSGWGQSSTTHVAMSSDGKWIVPDSRGNLSPSGADLMSVDEGTFAFKQIRDYHSSFGQIIAGPHNRYWSFGKDLYGLDITKKIRSFSGSPVAIHPQLDMAVSLSEKGFHIESFSTAKNIATEKITSTVIRRSSSSRSRPTFDTVIQYDLKNQMAFVGQAKSGHWFDLSAYKGELKPLRMIKVVSEVTAFVGKETRVPFEILNGSPSIKARVASKDTIQIRGNELVYSPTADQVGNKTVSLELVNDSGTVLDKADFTLKTTLPSIDFDFNTASMAVSNGGTKAVVWGSPFIVDKRGRRVIDPESSTIAVIDLPTSKILNQRTMPSRLMAVAIDEKNVFFAPSTGSLFYRSDHNLKNSKRTFVSTKPQMLVKVADNVIAVSGERVAFYNVSTLKEVSYDKPTPKLDSLRKQRSGGYPSESSRTKQLYLPYVTAHKRNTGISSFRNRGVQQQKWGRIITRDSLKSTTGNMIKQWTSASHSLLCDAYPMAVLISSNETSVNQSITRGTDRTRRKTTQLQLRDLTDGNVQYSSAISVVDSNGYNQSFGSSGFFGSPLRLTQVGKFIYYLDKSKLYKIAIPLKEAEAMPTPTHFLEMDTFEVNVGKKEVVQLSVKGPVNGCSFEINTQADSIQLDEETGRITIDTQALWKLAIEKFSPSEFGENLNSGDYPYPSPDRFSRREGMQQLIWSRNGSKYPGGSSSKSIAESYNALTGKKLSPEMLAFKLLAQVQLTDNEGQTDRADITVIVVGPRKPLDEKMVVLKAEAAKRKAEQEKMVAKRKAEMAARREQEKGESSKSAGSSSNAERIAELQKRVRRMEATLDAILEKLDKLDQSEK